MSGAPSLRPRSHPHHAPHRRHPRPRRRDHRGPLRPLVPPAPLPARPHHTTATRTGSEVHLRVLFATDPANEPTVRARITAALSAGHVEGPDEVTTNWKLLHSAESTLSATETEHAERLVRT